MVVPAVGGSGKPPVAAMRASDTRQPIAQPGKPNVAHAVVQKKRGVFPSLLKKAKHSKAGAARLVPFSKKTLQPPISKIDIVQPNSSDESKMSSLTDYDGVIRQLEHEASKVDVRPSNVSASTGRRKATIPPPRKATYEIFSDQSVAPPTEEPSNKKVLELNNGFKLAAPSPITIDRVAVQTSSENSSFAANSHRIRKKNNTIAAGRNPFSDGSKKAVLYVNAVSKLPSPRDATTSLSPGGGLISPDSNRKVLSPSRNTSPRRTNVAVWERNNSSVETTTVDLLNPLETTVDSEAPMNRDPSPHQASAMSFRPPTPVNSSNQETYPDRVLPFEPAFSHPNGRDLNSSNTSNKIAFSKVKELLNRVNARNNGPPIAGCPPTLVQTIQSLYSKDHEGIGMNSTLSTMRMQPEAPGGSNSQSIRSFSVDLTKSLEPPGSISAPSRSVALPNTEASHPKKGNLNEANYSVDRALGVEHVESIPVVPSSGSMIQSADGSMIRVSGSLRGGVDPNGSHSRSDELVVLHSASRTTSDNYETVNQSNSIVSSGVRGGENEIKLSQSSVTHALERSRSPSVHASVDLAPSSRGTLYTSSYSLVPALQSSPDRGNSFTPESLVQHGTGTPTQLLTRSIPHVPSSDLELVSGILRGDGSVNDEDILGYQLPRSSKMAGNPHPSSVFYPVTHPMPSQPATHRQQERGASENRVPVDAPEVQMSKPEPPETLSWQNCVDVESPSSEVDKMLHHFFSTIRSTSLSPRKHSPSPIDQDQVSEVGSRGDKTASVALSRTGTEQRSMKIDGSGSIREAQLSPETIEATCSMKNTSDDWASVSVREVAGIPSLLSSERPRVRAGSTPEPTEEVHQVNDSKGRGEGSDGQVGNVMSTQDPGVDDGFGALAASPRVTSYPSRDLLPVRSVSISPSAIPLGSPSTRGAQEMASRSKDTNQLESLTPQQLTKGIASFRKDEVHGISQAKSTIVKSFLRDSQKDSRQDLSPRDQSKPEDKVRHVPKPSSNGIGDDSKEKNQSGTKSLKKRAVLNTSISVGSITEKVPKPVVRRERSLVVADPCAVVSDTLNNFAAAGITGLGEVGLMNERISETEVNSSSELLRTSGELVPGKDAGHSSFFLSIGQSWARTFNPVFGTAVPATDEQVQPTSGNVNIAISHDAQSTIVPLQSRGQKEPNDQLSLSVGKSEEEELQIEVRLASTELLSFEATQSSASKRADDISPIYYLSETQMVDGSKKVDEISQNLAATKRAVLPCSEEDERARKINTRKSLLDSQSENSKESQIDAPLTTTPNLKLKTSPMIAGSDSDDDTPEVAPAVDTKAVMAALESTLPQQVRDVDHLSPPVKSPKSKRGTPRKKKGKSNKKSTKPPSPLVETNTGKIGRSKSVAAAKKKSGAPKEYKDVDDKKQLLERKVSLPKEIALSSDDPVSDLDQSIRHFPMKQIFAGGSVDVSGLGHSRDDVSASTHNEEEVDRYAPLISSGQKGASRAVNGTTQSRGPRALADSVSETEKQGTGNHDWVEENIVMRHDIVVSTEGLANGCLQSPLSQFLFSFPWSGRPIGEETCERKQAVDPKEGYKINVQEPDNNTHPAHHVTRFPDPPRQNHDSESQVRDESNVSERVQDIQNVRRARDPFGVEPAPSHEWKRRNGTDPPTSEKFIVYETSLAKLKDVTAPSEDRSGSSSESNDIDQGIPRRNNTKSERCDSVAAARESPKRQAETSLESSKQGSKASIEAEKEIEVDRYTCTDPISPGSRGSVVPALSNDDFFTVDRQPLPALLSTIHEEDSQGIADTVTGSVGKQSETLGDNGHIGELNQTFIDRILKFGQDSLGLSPRSREELDNRIQDLSPVSKRMLETSIKQAKVERSTSKNPEAGAVDIIDLTGIDEDDLFKKAEDDDDVWIFDLTKRSNDDDSFRDIDELLGFASARLGIRNGDQGRSRARKQNDPPDTLKEVAEAVIIVQGASEGNHVVVKGNDTWISLDDGQNTQTETGLNLSTVDKDRYSIITSSIEAKLEGAQLDRYSVEHRDVEEDSSDEAQVQKGNASDRYHCEPINESNVTSEAKRESQATHRRDAVICGMEEYEIVYPSTPPGPAPGSKNGTSGGEIVHRPHPNLKLGIETGRESRLSDEHTSRMSSLSRMSSRTVDPGPLAPKIGHGVSEKRVFNFVFTGDEDTYCPEEEDPVNGSEQTVRRGFKPEEMHFIRRVVKAPHQSVLARRSLSPHEAALDIPETSPAGGISPQSRPEEEDDRRIVQDDSQMSRSLQNAKPDEEEAPLEDETSAVPHLDGTSELVKFSEGVEFLDFLCDGPLIVCGADEKTPSLTSASRRDQKYRFERSMKGKGTSAAGPRETDVSSPIQSFEVDIPQTDKKQQKRFFASYSKTKQLRMTRSKSTKYQGEKPLDPEHEEALRQTPFINQAQNDEVIEIAPISCAQGRIPGSSIDQEESPLSKILPSNSLKSSETNPQNEHDLLDTFFEGTESFICPNAAEKPATNTSAIEEDGASKEHFETPNAEERIVDRLSAGHSACPSGITEPVCNRRRGPTPEEFLAQKKPKPHPESVSFGQKEKRQKQRKHTYRKGPAPEENSLADWLERNTVVVERGPVPEENRVVICGVRVVRGVDVSRPSYPTCRDIQEVEGMVVEVASEAPKQSVSPREELILFANPREVDIAVSDNISEEIPESDVPTVWGLDLNPGPSSSSPVENLPRIDIVPGVDGKLPGIHVVPGVDLGTERATETTLVRVIDDLCFDLSQAFSGSADSPKVPKVVKGLPCDASSDVQEVQKGENVTHAEPSASDYIAWASGKYELSIAGNRASVPTNANAHLPQSGAVVVCASGTKDIEVFDGGSHISIIDSGAATHLESDEEATDDSFSDPLVREDGANRDLVRVQSDIEVTQIPNEAEPTKSLMSPANASVNSSPLFSPNSAAETEGVSQAETKKAGNGKKGRHKGSPREGHIEPTDEGTYRALHDDVENLGAEGASSRSDEEAKEIFYSSGSDLALRLYEITEREKLSPRTALKTIGRDAGDSISCGEDSAIVASILQTARVIGWGLRTCNAGSGTRTANAEVARPDMLLRNDSISICDNGSSDSQDSKSHARSTCSSKAKTRPRADAMHDKIKSTILSQEKRGLSPQPISLSPGDLDDKEASKSPTRSPEKSSTRRNGLDERVTLPSIEYDTTGQAVPLEINVGEVHTGLEDASIVEEKGPEAAAVELPRLGSVGSDDESGLLLALTRSEGEPPVVISSEESSTANGSPWRQSKEDTKAETTEQRPYIPSGIPSAVLVKEGGPRKEFTRSPKLQRVLERLRRRKRNGGSDQSVSSVDADPVDVDELFSRYDDIVKHMVVFDNDRLQRAQGQLSLLGETSIDGNNSQTKELPPAADPRKSDVIDVTELHSTPFKLKRRATSQLRVRETIKVKQRAASQPKSREFSSIQVSSSFGSEASTPSQKARDLRKQLDLALKTSAAIRTTQERLGAELSNFKLKFQKQRESLSPARSRGSPRSLTLVSPKTTLISEHHHGSQHAAFPSPTVTEQTIVSGETPQVKGGSSPLPDVPTEIHRPMMAMTGNVVTSTTRLSTASPTFEQAVNAFDKIVSGQRLKSVTIKDTHGEVPDESRQPESPASSRQIGATTATSPTSTRQPESPASSRPVGATTASSPTSTRQSSERSPTTTEYESSVSFAHNDTSKSRLQLAQVASRKKKASSPGSISDASPFSSSTRRSVSEMSPIYYTIKDPKSPKNKSNRSPNFDKLATLMDADLSSDEELFSSSGEVSQESKEEYNGKSIYSPHDDYYDESFSDDDAVKMKQLESIINGLRSAEERQQQVTTTPKARTGKNRSSTKTGKKSKSRKTK